MSCEHPEWWRFEDSNRWVHDTCVRCGYVIATHGGAQQQAPFFGFRHPDAPKPTEKQLIEAAKRAVGEAWVERPYYVQLATAPRAEACGAPAEDCRANAEEGRKWREAAELWEGRADRAGKRAIALADECGRLRDENRELAAENSRLRRDNERLGRKR